MQIWELYSIILVDKLIKGCVKVNFEFKDKYDINDLISLITLLRAPEDALGTVNKLMNRLRVILSRKRMRLLKRLTKTAYQD